MKTRDEIREQIHRIQHQLVHPETYGFAPDPDRATDTIMPLIDQQIRDAELKGQVNLLNGILSINFKSVEDARLWVSGQRDMLEAQLSPKPQEREQHDE